MMKIFMTATKLMNDDNVVVVDDDNVILPRIVSQRIIP